ncbi:hypothetical protein B4U80_06290 [Leptotrombidium deliense]|uniref:Saccharopine dehydrogenase NADP binding domain-containing protein n=1 Tax=Leptotrombidium deliense TaxID=299467 RepID=A0A443SJ71_9ACAR|nr:hypothetical protein B4U80_06290 [Leptotrombidium deliense]
MVETSMESFELVREFDIVVFGSSGFTGVYVVEELIVSAFENKSGGDRELKWAVAGRNAAKTSDCLRKSIEYASKRVNCNIDWRAVKVIEAHVDDERSLRAMTARTQVLINCVGPYRHFGHNVVKACVETKTSYVDICGEPQFLEEVQLTYFKMSQDKQIYLIPACGFDSIPADLGLNFVKSNFKGTLDSVESYLTLESNGFTRGNAATWDCIVDGYAAADQLRPIRKALYSQLFSSIAKFKSKFSLKRRQLFQYSAPDSMSTNGYCLPFPGSDRSVVKRTQMHNYLLYKERPTDFEAYFVLPSLYSLLIMFFCALLFLICIPFKIGRYLMHTFPEVFTFGVFTRKPITREEVNRASFKMLFVGKGWKETLDDPLTQVSHSPDSMIYASVTGGSPGYPVTAVCVVQAAFAVVYEKDKLPNNGGVYTPGSAFRNTNLVKKLSAKGVKFELLSALSN